MCAVASHFLMPRLVLCFQSHFRRLHLSLTPISEVNIRLQFIIDKACVNCLRRSMRQCEDMANNAD